jgi:hypothetical protein
MTHSARCWRRRLIVLGLATSLLSGCARGSFDGVGSGTCPPVVDYSRVFQARVAEEMASLPDSAAIVEMLSDYAVVREHLRACRGTGTLSVRR